MPFLRFSRDKRGYEHTYLLHAGSRKGAPARILYWYRTPPGVRVGRVAFDEEVRQALESQYPSVQFDWEKLTDTPPPPPPDVEHWRERRRLEKAARQARQAAERDDESDGDELDAAAEAAVGDVGGEAGGDASEEPTREPNRGANRNANQAPYQDDDARVTRNAAREPRGGREGRDDRDMRAGRRPSRTEPGPRDPGIPVGEATADVIPAGPSDTTPAAEVEDEGQAGIQGMTDAGAAAAAAGMTTRPADSPPGGAADGTGRARRRRRRGGRRRRKPGAGPGSGSGEGMVTGGAADGGVATQGDEGEGDRDDAAEAGHPSDPGDA